ncbi:MAG: hypothetical protein LBU99_04810 [Spirochaetaceae bacterium]|jgi:hypothetical protein|nr:hypothetical protein [Spirochaetaceae bacterium]
MTTEILAVKENELIIKWSGLANIFWDKKYGADVPFETIFTVAIPTANSK